MYLTNHYDGNNRVDRQTLVDGSTYQFSYVNAGGTSICGGNCPLSGSNIVETVEYRINDCLRRSMNGTPLDPGDPAMRDIMAYFAFLSLGVAVGPPARPAAGPWTQMIRDVGAGATVFAASCARCHGADGQGTAAGPPVWGPRSYNIGAGMARVFTAASFIRKNMPFDQPGTLSDQQALDVAAYLNGQPRPDFKGKEHDWPAGGAPPDVAYRVLSMDQSH